MRAALNAISNLFLPVHSYCILMLMGIKGCFAAFDPVGRSHVQSCSFYIRVLTFFMLESMDTIEIHEEDIQCGYCILNFHKWFLIRDGQRWFSWIQKYYPINCFETTTGAAITMRNSRQRSSQTGSGAWLTQQPCCCSHLRSIRAWRTWPPGSPWIQPLDTVPGCRWSQLDTSKRLLPCRSPPCTMYSREDKISSYWFF
jgi:hypothetical protein